jgi:two-component system phosphate regulon response regulator PhoB
LLRWRSHEWIDGISSITPGVGEVEQAKFLILVDTEDIDLYLFVDHILRAEGLTTELASGLDTFKRYSAKLKPDLILLDYRGRSDLASICTLLEQDVLTNRIPRIALINQSAERYYVPQPKCGINDIFVTPILPAKLIKRILSILPSSQPERGG